MAKKKGEIKAIDGNTAAAHVAYAFSEVAAIFPITPSSPMGELADLWAAQGRKNIFDQSVKIAEMQSEAGASGAIHGSLTGGALTTTFTASQGLLLMLPNMFKIAGEMLPTVFHVAARSLSYQSLSIFGDHSDVMATRGTGFALVAANSPQEVHDLAVISHMSSVESKIPFLNFFDGFRTSSEIQKVELADYDILKKLFDTKSLEDFRSRGINSEHPYAKVGAQNPDVYFQGREVVNKYYEKAPAIVKKNMKKFYEVFGRKYKIFEYIGAKDATKIIIAMGSGCETIEETVNFLKKKGEKVGVVKIRLYRPFSIKDFINIIPKTVKKIAVLDRTKEAGSVGEPLYLDIVSALQGSKIKIIGGRYGLSSKEFNPIMVKAVFNHLDKACTTDFTVGINDDVTHKSIKLPEHFVTEDKSTVRCKFWGLGSDGTVGANKNSIKIIGDNTDMSVQGYFVYDSKKSGGTTVSHLRFGKKAIKSTYLLTESDFVALHNTSFIGKYDLLTGIKKNGTFLVNSSLPVENVFASFTKKMQDIIIKNNVKVYAINANDIAMKVGLGGKINTVMQTAFFKITNILPEKQFIKLIKKANEKTYIGKGKELVNKNDKAVDLALNSITKILVNKTEKTHAKIKQLIPKGSSKFAKTIIEPIMRLQGDDIKVSEMTLDGVVPVGTIAIEKRGISLQVPECEPSKCIQCGICSFSCPHAAIRIKQIAPKDLKNAPSTFKTELSRSKNTKKLQFKVQTYCEDCMSCGLCINACPTKALKFVSIEDAKKKGEIKNAAFFDALPNNITEGSVEVSIKGTQLKTPLFEFSGACAGCGEAPYIKLATQMFGDRMVIANATGCTSIYGGTFPTIPYTTNEYGQGPAWANSLFEDNAEYGFGMKLAGDANRNQLLDNVNKLLKVGCSKDLQNALIKQIKNWMSVDDKTKKNNLIIKALLKAEKTNAKNRELLRKIKELQDNFVEKSIWIIGGDGWAYDIGYGGLDHVLAQGKNVNVLVVDSEVYSNTGGQASKATPLGASAKFAASGKELPKKNLGLMMMNYGYIYVASVSLGANKMQLIKALKEAEEYNGPSIVIAYSPCIAHGIKKGMGTSQEIQKKAVDSGYWPLFRYNPSTKNPLTVDSKDSKITFGDYINEEIRYTVLNTDYPKRAKVLQKKAEESAKRRKALIDNLSIAYSKKE